MGSLGLVDTDASVHHCVVRDRDDRVDGLVIWALFAGFSVSTGNELHVGGGREVGQQQHRREQHRFRKQAQSK